MSKINELEILRAKVRDIVHPVLDKYETALNPQAVGNQIYNQLTSIQRAELDERRDLVLKQLFIDEAERQTQPRRRDQTQADLWPMNDWISAADPGKRVRYRFARWNDHQAHRENQIIAMRRQNASFEVDEQRREKLRDAGMATKPEMTTEDAVRELGEAFGEAAE